MKKLKKIKIIFSPAHYLLDRSGGGEYGWSYNIIRYLSDIEGLDLNVVCGNTNATNLQSVKIHKTFKKNTALSLFQKFIFHLKCFWVSRNILKIEKIDIIHHLLPFGYCQTFNLLPIFGFTKKVPFIVGPLQKPQTFIEKDFLFFIDEKLERKIKKIPFFKLKINDFILKITKNLLFYLSKKTLEKADLIICLDKETKRIYSEIVNGDKIIIIPTGVDAKLFAPKKKEKKDKIEILTVSYLYKRKRVDSIIKIFYELQKKYKNLKLTIVGDGPEEDSLKNFVKKLKINDIVNFMGRVDNKEIHKFYKKADIYLTMSDSEAFPVNIIESMSTGLPTVSNINRGSREIIEDGINGILVDSIESAVESIEEMINNEKMRSNLGKNARRIVEEKYDWKKIAEKYYRIYRDLC